MKRSSRSVWPIVLGCVVGSCGAGDKLTAPHVTPLGAFAVAPDTTTQTETFTGAAGPLSGSWTQQRSSGKTVNRNGSGVGIGSVDGLDLFVFWNATAFSNDQYSQTRIAGGLVNGTQFVQVIVRATGTGDSSYNNYSFYSDGVAGSGHTELARVMNGRWTTLRSFNTTFVSGDVMKISVTGSTITCYKNGVSIGTATDSSLPTGSPGVGVYGNTVTIDDWQGAIIVVAPPPPPAPPAPVASVTVSPTTANLTVGDKMQFTAVEKDSTGATLTGRTVTWSSDVDASVSSTGMVTAVAAGTANIVATSEGKTGSSSITIAAPPPPPPPGATQTENFTGAAGPLTGSWTQQRSSMGTVNRNGSGAGTGSSSIRDGFAFWNASAFGSDQSSQITIAGGLSSGTQFAEVTVRASGTDNTTYNAYFFKTDGSSGSGHTELWKVVAGSRTRLRTFATTFRAGDVIRIEARGQTITCYANGVSIGSFSDASLSGGAPGVGAYGRSIAIDNWVGQTLAPPVPVASITISSPTTPMTLGTMQQLTATTKDASGNVLTGRVVTWASSNTSALRVSASGATTIVTAAATGTGNITATSEAVSATTPNIQVNPWPAASGPLHVSSANPRYFADGTGQIVYLTGSEYWKTIQDNSPSNPPAPFDYSGFLDFLQRHNHNFTRLYMWEQARWSAETSLSHYFSPTLFVRTGPGTALDGGPKFDLTQINPDYLARVRQRAVDAGARGIYVSIMLFDGWSVGYKGNSNAANPWLAHPFNASNNINGIDGDPNGDAFGGESQTLSIPAITAIQDSYVRAVIDAVNDLDNVIYEVSNESDPSADQWQYHMISLIRSYEATKPKQHPIGMTVPYPNATNSEVLSSSADWVSMNGDINNLPVADGTKVSLSDTDHLCGICGDASSPWKSLMRGHNTLFMDGYDGSAGVGDPLYDPTDPKWEQIRTNMGYARSYALRMDLAHDLPHGELASSGYCLAGTNFLILLPSGGSVSVNLSSISGTRAVEWFNPANGQITVGGSVTGGSTLNFTAPFSGMAILFIHP
ncbi:MAG TPA: Ig-like domain-containing protein [Gemmatimonadaceae bacterium]|nr:Ig-like domain-containing protein [Gemmatimonadaceae bacterium]